MDIIDEKGLYSYLLEKGTPHLAENAIAVTFPRGKLVYDITQKYTDIFEIIHGAVKLGGISPKGEEYIYELVMAGEFFGNLAVLGDTFRENCKTLTVTQVRSYRSEFFKHLMTHDPVVAKWCFSKIVYRWNKTESLMANIRSYEPRERIQLLHKTLSYRIMTAANREVLLSKLVSNKDIADLTATTRQLVADTLKRS